MPDEKRRGGDGMSRDWITYEARDGLRTDMYAELGALFALGDGNDWARDVKNDAVTALMRHVDAAVAAAVAAALNDAAGQIDATRDADHKERTNEQNDGDGPTGDACYAPHWECHASAAYFGFDHAARIVRAAASRSGGTPND